MSHLILFGSTNSVKTVKQGAARLLAANSAISAEPSGAAQGSNCEGISSQVQRQIQGQ